MTERDITLGDGRTLHVYEAGDPGGLALLVHHGTPSGGLLYPPAAEDARGRGIRLIGFDRPGYGGSTARPGRVVADVAADVEELLDALGIDRFASVGASGGGPHTLALGALLADRCVAVCAIAAVAPWDAEGLDWLAGQGDQNRAEWAAALEGRVALESHLEREAAGLAAATPEQIREVLATLLSPPDRAVVTGGLAEHLHASSKRALAPGVAGWRDDDLSFTQAWGFELGEIRVPVLLWQGEQDQMVPAAHGRWLAERIPGVEAHFGPDDGHLTIMVGRVGEIHEWLRERA